MEEHVPVEPTLRIGLEEVATSAAGREGVVWGLEASSDLNANLVRFEAGRGVGEHVNGEVDVVFLGVSGSGIVETDGREYVLDAGTFVFVPRGARRSTRGGPEGFAYLTIHRRRGPLRIGVKADQEATNR